MKIKNAKISVISGSILDQDVQCLVNAAKKEMRGGGGLDGAIHHAAGRKMAEQLAYRSPYGAETGEPVLTDGFNLRQQYIIHVAGPVWRGGTNGEESLLKAAYGNALTCADSCKIESLAFPSISTGIYCFPLEKAAQIALRTTIEYLAENSDSSLRRVVFAMYQLTEFAVFEEALNTLQKTFENSKGPPYER